MGNYKNNINKKLKNQMKAVLAAVFLTAVMLFAVYEVQSGVFLPKDVDWPFSNCGGKSDPLKVSKITLGSTPAKGKALKIAVSGTASVSETSKKFNVTCKWNGIPAINKDFDETTPIAAGPFAI